MIKSGIRKMNQALSESVGRNIKNVKTQDVNHKADDVFCPGLFQYREALKEIHSLASEKSSSYSSDDYYKYAEECGVFTEIPENWSTEKDKWGIGKWGDTFRDEFEKFKEFYKENLQLPKCLETYYLSKHCTVSNYRILKSLNLVQPNSNLLKKLTTNENYGHFWLNSSWQDSDTGKAKDKHMVNFFMRRDIPVDSYKYLLKLGATPDEAIGYCFTFDEDAYNARKALYPKETTDELLRHSQALNVSEKTQLKKFGKWASDKSGKYVYYIECDGCSFTGNTDIFKGRIFCKYYHINLKDYKNRFEVKFFDNFAEPYHLVYNKRFRAPGSDNDSEVKRVAKKDTFLGN